MKTGADGGEALREIERRATMTRLERYLYGQANAPGEGSGFP
jgi:hypothetical protein